MASRRYRSEDLKRSAVDPFDTVDVAGIAIRFIGPPGQSPPQTHVGFLYRADDSPARLCHLRTHYDLVDEMPTAAFSWVQIDLDPIIKRLAVAACQSIFARTARIPFGFTFEGPYFVPTMGELIKKPIGFGLTCATFVLAIFRMIEVELLDTQTWKSRPDDAVWQLALTAAIGKQYPLLAGPIGDHIGDVRYKPEEVTAACNITPKPVKFDEAVKAAARILADLRRHQE